MANVLYISIIGMSEPLGKSQVLEYLQDLSEHYNIFLFSFEKNIEPVALQEIQERMNQYGITWIYRLYSNRYGILSTIQQVFGGILSLITLLKTEKIVLIHARSLIPVIIALPLKALFGVKVIFDVRGFQTDEKAEVGRIKYDSLLYKLLKWLEKFAYQKSDSVVTLTEASKKIIADMSSLDKIIVIPTCANKNVFKIISEKEKKDFRYSLGYSISDKIIIHAGAVSNWYDFDSELLLMQELMKKDSGINFLILNKGEHEFITKKLNKYNLDCTKTRIIEVNFYDMYKYLNIASASLFIIKPTFSKIASAPTKFAENLACGLFSITNNGIGDMDSFFSKYPSVGYSFDIKELSTSLDCISTTVLAKIAVVSPSEPYKLLYDKYLSKEMAIVKYSKIYERLISKKS